MKTSAGILIHDNMSLLMGHSTGNDFYDIPKGVVKEGEHHLDTMIRECNEEFGIDINKFLNDIVYLGEHDYSRFKSLKLYRLHVNYLNIRDNIVYINNETFNLHCSSHCTINNKEVLEIDGYELIDIQKINISTCRSFSNMNSHYKLL